MQHTIIDCHLPLTTLSPIFTLMLSISPGIGDPTEPLTPGRALGWKCIV